MDDLRRGAVEVSHDLRDHRHVFIELPSPRKGRISFFSLKEPRHLDFGAWSLAAYSKVTSSNTRDKLLRFLSYLHVKHNRLLRAQDL